MTIPIMFLAKTFLNAALFLQEKENENLQILDEVATRLTPTPKISIPNQ